MAFETADELISMLSHHWYKEPDGNLYKMLDIYSNDMEQINDSDQKVIEWRAIQNAEGSTLDLFGKDIKTARPTQDDGPYRFLIYLKTLLARAQGTIPSIFKIVPTATASDRNTGIISSEVDKKTASKVPMVTTFPAYKLAAAAEKPHCGKAPNNPPKMGPIFPDCLSICLV